MKYIIYAPVYLFLQIALRIPSDSTDRYNKWQPTLNQSLREFIIYELQYCPKPLKKGSFLIWSLIINIIILIAIF